MHVFCVRYFSFLHLCERVLQLLAQFSSFYCCLYGFLIVELTILLQRSVALLPFDIRLKVFTLMDCNIGLDAHFAYCFEARIMMD